MRMERSKGTCLPLGQHSTRWRGRNGSAVPRENVQLTMNNVQWAGMLLYGDVGMGCGAWGGGGLLKVNRKHVLI